MRERPAAHRTGACRPTRRAGRCGGGAGQIETHRHKVLTGLTWVWALSAAAIFCGGCMVSQNTYDKLAYKLSVSQIEQEKQTRANKSLQLALADKDRLIADLQALGDKRLERIFHVERITLGRYSGGVDSDDKPGDDGVRVYLRPVDQHGSTIKAAGSIRIQLYDLAATGDRSLLGTYEWSVDEAAGRWVSFMVHHYSLDCRWRGAPPEHEDVTIRAEFLDYLTGRRFTKQIVRKVHLAPRQ